MPKTCDATGCDKPVKAKGLCGGHYMRARRGEEIDGSLAERVPGGGVCEFEGCDKPRHGGTLCNGHYWQQREGRELTPLQERQSPGGECAVTDCGKTAVNQGLCRTHYERKRVGEPDWDRPIRGKAADGTGWIDPQDGYRYIRVDGRQVQEHRWVMEQHIGRPLLPHPLETVHHKRGGFKGRSNNDLSNLELWSGHHPAGHRAEDLAVYARELLALYGDAQERERYAEHSLVSPRH